jgi:hypothetical protein
VALSTLEEDMAASENRFIANGIAPTQIRLFAIKVPIPLPFTTEQRKAIDRFWATLAFAMD